MTKRDKDIEIDILKEYQPFEVDWLRLERLAEGLLGEQGVGRAEVSIVVADDSECARINMEYLSHEGPTDVISFDLSEDEELGGPRAFDIVVNADMAVREAARRGHSPEAELALYVVHGLLHGLGFDDAGEEDAARMHRAEDEILRRAGYGTIYTCE